MSQATPMMAQYLEIKAQHADALLFYRMGDFYELFFDDAIAASAALDIALTKRGKHENADIAMCGVPVRAAEGYFLTLIRKGFRVAVCEQMEDPSEAKKRGYKAVVRREVVRLVTPGTLTEDSLLDARAHNYLAAFALVRETAALAWVDISTGDFHVISCAPTRLGPELARLAPREVLLSDPVSPEHHQIIEDQGIAVTELGRASFDSTSGQTRLEQVFEVVSLEAFGAFERAELGAMGAIVDYLELTQKGTLPRLQPPSREIAQQVMQIDAATRRNLELLRSLTGDRDGTLLDVIDRTVTAGGARLLARRLSSPSTVIDEIDARLEFVEQFVENPDLSENLRDLLQSCPDLDRALSRLSLDRGGPRDLAAIRNALEQAHQITITIPKDTLRGTLEDLAPLSGLHDLLNAALVADPPVMLRDGGMIATGYDTTLDKTRKLRDEGRGVLAQMQADYATKAEVPALKIKHNNVLGYFIEVTTIHGPKLLAEPLSETFIHRQTTANAMRFTTVELSELETKILNAGARSLELEIEHFRALRYEILAHGAQLTNLARGLSLLDLSASLAYLARSEDWTKPKIDRSHAFDIQGGRHPVVEAALRRQGLAPFVANDCNLSGTPSSIWLLTGPNMAGKSTFLRQAALITILAQMGSYVPAKHAHIGLVSQVFSRVGASDDLARGRSTFMVEMVETAAILNQADDRALVILDEIGRGTATYDGLSIAWATLEHLHNINKSRALFATHYHEMTALAGKLQGVENATVAVKEHDGDVIFLHEVHKGAADRSYGVQVAKLAGLPPPVIARARHVLDALEKGNRESGRGKSAMIDDLPLFAATPAPSAAASQPSEVEARLKELAPDELTPRAALDLIYELKKLV